MSIHPLRLFSIIVVAFSLAACASAKLATPEQDAAAKQFNPEAGKANIYIYRNEGNPFSTQISVSLDGAQAGNLDKDTYMILPVPPGRHIITAHAENRDSTEIITEEGKDYFIWLESRLGAITNHAHFHHVSEEKGEAGVSVCKLVEGTAQ